MNKGSRWHFFLYLQRSSPPVLSLTSLSHSRKAITTLEQRVTFSRFLTKPFIRRIPLINNLLVIPCCSLSLLRITFCSLQQLSSCIPIQPYSGAIPWIHLKVFSTSLAWAIKLKIKEWAKKCPLLTNALIHSCVRISSKISGDLALNLIRVLNQSWGHSEIS